MEATYITVIERHRHGFDVFPDSNCPRPFGSNATCVYSYGSVVKNSAIMMYSSLIEEK